MATFKPENGLLIFKGTDKKKNHVGVYCDGYVIEAKGHAYGVKKTKLNNSWGYWAQCHLIEEGAHSAPTSDAASKPSNSSAPTANAGDGKSGASNAIVKTPVNPTMKTDKFKKKMTVVAVHGLNMRESAGMDNKINKIMTVLP